jgi:hypothetical protein
MPVLLRSPISLGHGSLPRALALHHTRATGGALPFYLGGISYGGALSIHAGLHFSRQCTRRTELDQCATLDFTGVLLMAPAVTGNLPPAPVIWILRNCCKPCCPTRVPFFMPNPVSEETIWHDPVIRCGHTQNRWWILID